MSGNRPTYQSGPSIFKKLVRLSARTFYSGPCPPRAEGVSSRKKWEKVDTTGLAIIILDNLTQQEWVKEENLSQEIKVAPKLLVRALRYLEQERVLRHESRKEGKRAQAKDVVVLATKKESTSQAETEVPQKPSHQSYWAIDYPSFWDVLRLRLHLMRFKIKSEVEDSNAVMEYVCPQCNNRYSCLDFTTLLNRQTGKMQCEDCGTEVLEDFGNEGGTGKVEDRRQRREDMKAMLKKMDTELKPILDLMNQAKDIKPPDYGCLSDWAYERSTRKKRTSKAQDGGDDRDIAFDVDLSAPSPDALADESRKRVASNAKELPPWLIKSSRMTTQKSDAAEHSLKRKVNEILPPPVDTIPEPPSQEIQLAVSTPAPALTPVDDSAQVQKKPKIVDLTEEFGDDDDNDDGIEWEPVEVDVAMHDEQEDASFDAEAARLADIESDLRTNSGWTTVVQK